MSHPPHRIQDDWMCYIREDLDLIEAKAAPTTVPEEGISFPWRKALENNLKFAPSPFDLANELGERQPVDVRDPRNDPPATGKAFSITSGQDIIRDMSKPGVSVDSDSMVCTDVVPALIADGTVASTSSPVANTSSGSHTKNQRRHGCAVCPRSFDRIQRARACANKHLGLEPFVCGGSDKAYSSEVHLHEHLASTERRNMKCPKCGRTVLRKNIARHNKQKVCLQEVLDS
ncbi:hypothetical protein M408DRAFT_30643 [Serendipita vermifera MAFF 305830]|uniref:C2H2-type domain-containing protein n=1 Tax=Serendipita vermifera MAFF 305830 TaxID=933852 RepID=A0A0C2W0T9_SERVB|nr:hypothetical protein M408DRAFT_30643 [Serendipita vermifera MAFF 305830]